MVELVFHVMVTVFVVAVVVHAHHVKKLIDLAGQRLDNMERRYYRLEEKIYANESRTE